MTVETQARYISDLNVTYPRPEDLISEGDDHIRIIKSVLKATLPGLTGATKITNAKLDNLDDAFTNQSGTLVVNNSLRMAAGKSLDMGGSKITNVGDPSSDTDLITLKYMKTVVLSSIYPINSIYMTTDVRDPKDILGFGTWARFASGRTLIGSGDGVDLTGEQRHFNNGAVGGNYGHALTSTELPVHTHGGGTLKASFSGEHKHLNGGYARSSWSPFPWGEQAYPMSRYSAAEHHEGTADTMPYTEPAGGHTHTITGATDSTGGADKVELLSPYIVCNIWVRTA